jgi:glycosyltransferase involved in cell wall biosynthesis
MKVLIPNHFPLEGSGSGIYTQNVARELVEQGHEALVITPSHDQQDGYPFQVRSILFSPDGAGGKSPDGAGAKSTDAQGAKSNGRLPFNFPCFTTHPLSTTKYADLDKAQRELYVASFESAIFEEAKRWKPAIVHAQHLWTTAYVASKLGLPYVATAHGTDLMGFRWYEEWRAMALKGAAKANAIIAVSGEVARDTVDLYGVPDGRVQVIWNGFNTEIFRVMPVERDEVLKDYGLEPGINHMIAFTGKLAEFKGIDVLLQAAAIYEKALGNVSTLIVGDGGLLSELQDLAKQLDLRGVHFLGHQTQDKVARIMNVSDLAVVPSRIEPFGLVAIEALACGTPVIATNQGGLPEFVNESVGALVDVDDAEGLAAAVIQEIESDSKRVKGPVAAEYARDGFSWSTQVGNMIELYETAI